MIIRTRFAALAGYWSFLNTGRDTELDLLFMWVVFLYSIITGIMGICKTVYAFLC